MNIFFRELKNYKWSIIFWSLGMVALIGSSLAKFSAYSTNGQSISDLLKTMPQSLQTIFGLTGFDLNNVSGYIGVTFMYIALTATIHAVLLGANIISKEERDRTSEFLMSKPVSRSRVVIYKISAGVFNLVVLNLVTLGSTMLFADYFSKGKSTESYVLLLMAGLFFMQLLFFFIGATVAAISRKPKLSTSIASSVMLVTFIMTYFIKLNHDFDNLKYFTPFKYFDAGDILKNNSVSYGYVILSLALLAIMTVAIFWGYKKRDLNV